MYSVSAYGGMIRDRIRMEAYEKALQQTITPDSVVIDIGTGTGIHALLACQFGARRVYAIEPASAIHVARETAQANGYGDRIEFIQDLSTQVTLPEQADVIVSDLHGVLPWYTYHIPTILDARKRLLKPGGILLPQSDTVWGTVVEAPELYQEYVHPWQEKPYGLDISAGLRVTTNYWGRGRASSEQFLAEPVSLAIVDYTTVENPNLNVELTWTAKRAGTAHGCMVWFDTTVAPGVHLTSAPDAPEISYGSAFFPWLQAVSLAADDTVSFNLRADWVGGEYVWSWNTRVLSQGQAASIKADFKQSTFWGQLLSPKQLRKPTPVYVPQLNENGQIDRRILESMDSQASLKEIAHQISIEFSARFATWQDALGRVQELSALYSQ
jgi:type I protein arginine methyltransferase